MKNNLKLSLITLAIVSLIVLIYWLTWYLFAFKHSATIKFTTTDTLHQMGPNKECLLVEQKVVFDLTKPYEGKHKPIFAVQVKSGDGVLLKSVLSDEADLSSNKLKFTMYFPDLRFKTNKDGHFIVSFVDQSNLATILSASYIGKLLY